MQHKRAKPVRVAPKPASENVKLGSFNTPELSAAGPDTQAAPAEKPGHDPARNRKYSSEFGRRLRASRKLIDLAFRGQRP